MKNSYLMFLLLSILFISSCEFMPEKDVHEDEGESVSGTISD